MANESDEIRKLRREVRELKKLVKGDPQAAVAELLSVDDAHLTGAFNRAADAAAKASHEARIEKAKAAVEKNPNGYEDRNAAQRLSRECGISLGDAVEILG